MLCCFGSEKMIKEGKTKYSASDSLVGYLYQCRLALFETLKRLKTNPSITVAVETLDDVVFETNGTPTEIIQVKHHINRQANLTDASTDLWKTIRIWCDFYQNGIPQSGTVLCIMTTSRASKGSAAYYLRAENRDIAAAEKILLQTAQMSVSKENNEAYSRFSNLTSESRLELLKATLILDQCPLNEDLDHYLQKEIWYVCQRSKIDQFLMYFEGWWFKRVLKSMCSECSMPILGEELDSQLNELREQFKSDALPIHADLKTATVDCKLYQNHTFVRQLELIDVGSKRISIAVNNYYRAFEQRSRWLREDLLLVGDIGDYERNLLEEWETHFETMCEELGEDAAEQEKIKAARNIYNWVEKEADFPIRKCQEPFITRGSYHILADKQKVGWHPEFQNRLTRLLEGKEVAG
ncbi:hypothetical protein DU57_09150 [Methanosarcina mazei]|uniref:ABC-three component systems C-terminal domain-containing protein n=2 Tax=Methanosarcina mazei TaxID=2209 RepID=A0A0F8LAA2_METMZ|nr:hypothetical protein DU40_10850 [Methanosarcina mazei]KKG19204.1 hypothetical protein DU34_11605 [Methanosarcina mazei]KKG75767.1 hypothetical protein DU63_18520 [Methanosarcina mazei]KKG84936.1 hypothetical protein DU59_09695 [Methanosarcina mazei]KKG90245.1 hypothetical protein DU57_09150 [Methanosarcina mazei]